MNSGEAAYIKTYAIGAYIKTYDIGFSYKPLVPTGRWKIESGPRYKNRLFIEHERFRFFGLYSFTEWIDEAYIYFLPARQTAIFDCAKEKE
jgi:hypothetical protein